MSTFLPVKEPGISYEDNIEKAVRMAGLNYLYPYQRLAVRNIISGAEDPDSGDFEEEEILSQQAVFLPTGMGKSLIFTLPAFVLEGLTIIIYPLLSLMNDQINRFRELGLEALTLRGGQSFSEREKIFEQMERGEVDVLISNPETLGNKEIRGRLSRLRIDHLAVDEVHTASEWGNSFRPAYKELPEIIHSLEPRFLSVLTATASPSVKRYIREEIFRGEAAYWIDRPPDRPTIRYSVIHTLSPRQSLEELVTTKEKPIIVFCRTRRECEVTSRNLLIRGLTDDCLSYHAGYSAEARLAVEKHFMKSQNGILVATIAFGMGTNKNNVRTVIHLAPSQSPEAYLQESGRAGRDGKTAEAILLYNPFSSGDSLMDAYATSTDSCLRKYLLESLGYEEEYCFGCDICEGRVPGISSFQAGTAALIQSLLKRKSISEAVRILKGYWPPEASSDNWNLEAAWGRLHHWSRDAVREAVESFSGRIDAENKSFMEMLREALGI